MTTRGLTDALRETLATFDRAGTPRTTPEVADSLGIGRRTAYARLERLVEDDRLNTKKVGASARVWWRPPTAPTVLTGRDGPETADGDVRGRTDDACVRLDTDLRVTDVTGRTEGFLGRPPEDALAPGTALREVFEAGDAAQAVCEDALDAQEPRTFEAYSEPSDVWVECRVHPVDGGLSVAFTQASERAGRERERGETETRRGDASGASEVGLWSWDLDDDVVSAGPFLTETSGVDAEADASGVPVDDLVAAVHENDRDRLHEAVELAREETDEFEVEFRLRDAEGDWQWVLMRGEVEYDGDDQVRMHGALVDVTDRHSRERELADRTHQQEVVMELGRQALAQWDIDPLLTAASERIAETLDADYAKVLEYRPEGDDLLLRAGTGWEDGWVSDVVVGAGREYQAGYTLQSAEPVVVNDYEGEDRFVRSELLRAHDIASGISVAVGPPSRPWGVLSVHATSRRQFSTNDISFVQSVANVLHPAVERHQREQELERQHERLTALNGLNEVVHDIVHAVIEQSTREEIEATVCERLAETDSYLFAWTGEVDTATRTVTLRTEAGVDGYLDGVTISVDPDDDRSEGPTGRALRTKEIQVTNDIEADSRHDPWRDHVERYGFRSSAAIPILHEGTVYGVLNVYAERPHAFTGQERSVVAQLGEIVGHAIVATERKQALISDEVVEIQFVIDDVFDSLDIASDLDDPVVLERVVPVEGDDYLFYGHTTPAGVEAVEGMVDALPFYESVRFRTNGDERPFELSVSDPPVLPTVSALDGSVEEAVIEDGDYRLTVHLPPGSDVGTLVETMMETYPDARLLKRRQVTKRDDGTRFTASALTSDLTARQRTALEAAYHAGFFEWPRESDGGDVASSLGVSPPTFHQHLRKGEQKIFDALLGSLDVGEDAGREKRH